MAITLNNDGKLDSYAWPGGYPMFYLDRENSVLCPECATKSMAKDELPQFRPVAQDINWEDTSLHCDQCSQRIESAYGDN